MEVAVTGGECPVTPKGGQGIWGAEGRRLRGPRLQIFGVPLVRNGRVTIKAPMDAARRPEYAKLLLSLIPESGESVGNSSLREKVKGLVAQQNDELNDQDYWLLRDSLIDEGLIVQGRGRGGSVHRIVKPAPAPEPEPVAQAMAEKPPEGDLYEPLLKSLIAGYTKENRIKRFVSEITARQGGRLTGGRWTRPDITLAAVRTYQFTPGKRLEVITFEVKPTLDTALEGVYEALAHSAFAHRTYLAVDQREYGPDDEVPDERIVQECTRHGVGYIVFDDPADYDTFNIMCSAKLNEPDPYDVDSFIRTQLSPEAQEQLRELLV